MGSLVHGTKGIELEPAAKLSLSREGVTRGIRAGQVSVPFPSRGQAGPGTLHSHCWTKVLPAGFLSAIHLALSVWAFGLSPAEGGARGAVGRVPFQSPQPGRCLLRHFAL